MPSPSFRSPVLFRGVAQLDAVPLREALPLLGQLLVRDEHIDALIAESPFYAKAVIPAATYNMPEDATTVAVSAVVIAADDVADADVYNFLYGVFENLDAIAQVHDKANELSLEFASSFAGVPYHSGAVQYFADKGITVEGK